MLHIHTMRVLHAWKEASPRLAFIPAPAPFHGKDNKHGKAQAPNTGLLQDLLEKLPNSSSAAHGSTPATAERALEGSSTPQNNSEGVQGLQQHVKAAADSEKHPQSLLAPQEQSEGEDARAALPSNPSTSGREAANEVDLSRLCRFYATTGRCPRGDVCKYLHVHVSKVPSLMRRYTTER